MDKFIIGYLIVLACVGVAYKIGKGKTKRGKVITWGSMLTFPLSLTLALTLGIHYSYVDNSSLGFELAVFLFPTFFIIGLITIIIGIFMKKENN